MTVEWPGFDLSQFLNYLLQIAGAYVLVLPVAWERERATRIMGLRTFPLVAVASCAYVLVAVAVVGTETDAHSRVIQGLMTGVGFIGGGAILKEGVNVRGTATAASVWSVGCLLYTSHRVVVAQRHVFPLLAARPPSS